MTKPTRTTTALISSLTIIFLAFAIGRLSVTTNTPTTPTTISSIRNDNGKTHHFHITTTTTTTHTVLITGATGRTGSLLYSFLKNEQPQIIVRALVRNATKARDVLHCTYCDERDGIYVGDVTHPPDLVRAALGVDTLVLLAAAGMGNTIEEQKAIEFDAVVDSVVALGQEANIGDGDDDLRVVLCSSMGTTRFSGDNFGQILFWKLNAEAFLASSGLGTTIVKPCGLTNDAGGNATLLVGHHDSISINKDGNRYPVTRADVAAVMAQAVVSRSEGLRFDLCSEPGPGTTDLDGLLEGSRWEWDR